MQKHIDQWWYLPLMGLLAGLDHYIIILPIDAMMVSCVLIHPKKWVSTALWFAFGSALGAISIASFTTALGLPFIDAYFPALTQSSHWNWAQSFFATQGIGFIFLSAAAPVPQQPAMIIAALASVALWKIALVVSLGRLLKFIVIGYLAYHAPEQLQRLWPIRKELEAFEVPVQQSVADKTKK